MKFIKNKTILLGLFAIICLSVVLSKNLKGKSKKHKKQVHVVRDMNGFSADVNQITRRDQSVVTATRLGNYGLSPVSNFVHSSNSNTSSAPNVGDLGRTASLVQPHIVVHSKSPISVVKETPAHIGYRNEDKTLTSMNMDTGKVESHTIHNKVPIYGNIQEAKTVYRNDVRSYDIENRRFGPIRSTFSDS